MPEANTQAADGRQCALPLGPVPHAMPLDAFAAPITRRGPRITKSRTSGRQGVLPVTELVATAPFVGPSRPSRPVPRAGTAPEPSHPARAEHGGRHGRPAPLALTPVTGAAADGETGPAPARENGIPVGPAAEDAALAPAPGSHGSPAGKRARGPGRPRNRSCRCRWARRSPPPRSPCSRRRGAGWSRRRARRHRRPGSSPPTSRRCVPPRPCWPRAAVRTGAGRNRPACGCCSIPPCPNWRNGPVSSPRIRRRRPPRRPVSPAR